MLEKIIYNIILPGVGVVLLSWMGYIIFRTKQEAKNKEFDQEFTRVSEEFALVRKELKSNDDRLRKELNDSDDRKDQSMTRAFNRIEHLEEFETSTRSYISESNVKIDSLLVQAATTDGKLDGIMSKVLELASSMGKT